MRLSEPIPSGAGRWVPHGPAACVCIAGTPGRPVAAHVTMATWRGLGQISLMMTGVCGPRGLTAWPARSQWDMASGQEPAAPPPVTPLRAAERGEHWWPVALAIIVVVGLHVALPVKYRVNPPWVLPVVLLALLAALIIGDPGRIDRQKTWLRVTTSAVIALLTLANLFAAVRLVGAILTNNKLFSTNATGLLATGAVIWSTNVIAFGLWYWDLDRGGAAARAHHP